MYVPRHFAPAEHDVAELLAQARAANLITVGPDGFEASMLPFLHDAPRGTLCGHLARNNEQWAHADGRPCLVILTGPDAYISPGWYPSKAEHGKVVPTWNYTTVHVHGTVTVHDDNVWVENLVRRLTDHHESTRADPWSVDDAPAQFVAGQLRAIIGIEVHIERIEAKSKLSQNRPPADIDGVVVGLRAVGDQPSADAVTAHRPPPPTVLINAR